MTEVNAQPEESDRDRDGVHQRRRLAIAETNYREMKERVESMGAVNMMALRGVQRVRAGSRS